MLFIISSKQHVGPSNLSHSPCNCIFPQYVALLTGGGHGLQHTGKNMMAINKTSYRITRGVSAIYGYLLLSRCSETQKNCVTYRVGSILYCLKKLPLSKDIYFARIMNEPEIFIFLLYII